MKPTIPKPPIPTFETGDNRAVSKDTETVSVSTRILVYGILCSFLVSLMLSGMTTFLAWSSLRQVGELQASLVESRQRGDVCQASLTRAVAKLEMVSDLFKASRGNVANAIGGP